MIRNTYEIRKFPQISSCIYQLPGIFPCVSTTSYAPSKAYHYSLSIMRHAVKLIGGKCRPPAQHFSSICESNGVAAVHATAMCSHRPCINLNLAASMLSASEPSDAAKNLSYPFFVFPSSSLMAFSIHTAQVRIEQEVGTEGREGSDLRPLTP